ncbi:MAG: hypothetical protein HQM12_10400 [SAR324 cluster bacterium]|nr:hypothetical protein [SAR324 cluster bacterium]
MFTSIFNLAQALASMSTSSMIRPLKIVNLDGNTPFSVFTHLCKVVYRHYVNKPGLRGYFQCNGDDCLWCDAGIAKKATAFLPVSVPSEREIQMLPMPVNNSPGALLPQVLSQAEVPDRTISVVTKLSNYSYDLKSRPLGQDEYDCAQEIEDFMKKWDAGEIDLESLIPQLSNEELEELPWMQELLRFK